MARRIFYVLIMLVLWSCTNESVEISNDYDFFPLEKGLFWEYETTQESYSVTLPAEKRTYQIRERIGESYMIGSQEVFRLERYTRPNENFSWKLDSVWSVQKSANQIIRKENNQAFIKLFFPIQEKQKWNPTGSKSVTYEYRSLYQAFGKDYPNTVSVVEQDDSTAINFHRKKEIYAKAIGLVYKENTSLEYCQRSPLCIGKGEIEYGYRLIMRLRKYGKD